jgi:hypothetical protein
MAHDDPFFGYDIASLRQASSSLPAPQVPFASGGSDPGAPYKSGYRETWYPDTVAVSYADTPAPDSADAAALDIEMINTQIMGEQPKTAEYRADQWAKLSALLSSTGAQLRAQTVELASDWESPQAKEIFLNNVGMTLAYLDVWHQAASTTSFALRTLAEIMLEAQEEMDALYHEYQGVVGAEKSIKKKEASVGTAANPAVWDKYITKDTDKYNQKARELASRVASRYAPIIQQLETGRATKVTTLNAVAHPGVYGPMPPAPTLSVPPPSTLGGSPPRAPTGAPSLSATPNALAGKAPLLVNGAISPPAPTRPVVPNAPSVQNLPAPNALPDPNVLPVSPEVPALNAPTVPSLSDNALAQLSALGALPAVFGGTVPRMGATPGLNTTSGGVPSLGASSATGASLPASLSTSMSASTGLYPPGTINPPPGVGAPSQLKQQGKVLGQRPPPQSGAHGGARTPGSSTGSPAAATSETPEAFRPPAASTAPVLDNRKRKGTRPGGAGEATRVRSGAPDATSPVLSNPHRTGPAKTYTEQRKERRLARLRQQEQATPEPSSGLPTPTAPVLEGRTAPAKNAPTAEIPVTLRGREPAPAARDQHAPPRVQADRTTRAPQQAEVVSDLSTWEVATPGGPVVAGGSQPPEQQYRAQPPAALGGS